MTLPDAPALGIMIDIAHAGDAAQRQIIDASQAPVVDSHTGMRAVCDNRDPDRQGAPRKIGRTGARRNINPGLRS